MSRRQAMPKDADWLGLVEAAYAPAPDLDTWGTDVVDAARATFPDAVHVGMMAIRHDGQGVTREVVLTGGAAAREFAGKFLPAFVAGGPRLVRALFYPPELVAAHVALEKRLGPEDRELLAMSRRTFRAADVLGLMVHPDPGVPGALWAALPREVSLPRHEIELLSRVALHVEAGLRLRLRPESIRAVFRDDGKTLHLEGDDLDVAKLGERVRRIERSRGDLECLTLWGALLDGRMSLAPRREGSRRHYYVLENAPASASMRALSAREMQVLAQASRGVPAKVVAYALGISASSVSNHLAHAASKLGIATRLELLRIAATLNRDPRADSAEVELSRAEEDVLALVGQGLTNAEIARMRNRSVRTIANQVAALLRKTGSTSRRALATLH